MSFGSSGPTFTETIDGEPVYRILVLGARGSGKTVFLSALYGHLTVANPVNRFAIEVSAEHRRILGSYYDCLCNPKLPWPDGTGKVTDFEFNCVHSTRESGRRLPLFRIRYKDFPGAYLTEEHEDDEWNISIETQSAHSILVLIDGRKVFEKLEGCPIEGETIESDLNCILPLLECSSRKPIHFLVTKWDILRGLHPFSSVKDALFECEAFSNFVMNRQDTAVRLVPVSAVGSDFAKFDLRSHAMLKLQSRRIRPYNVDLSIVLTLMDQIRAIGRAAILHKRVPFWIVRIARGSTLLSSIILESLNLGEWQLPFIPRVRPAPILKALSKAEGSLARLEKRLHARVSKTNDRRAVAQTIYEMQACRMQKFILEFPESQLTEASSAWLPNTGRF